MTQTIIFSVAAIILLFNILKEIISISNIKGLFKCEHCNTLNNEIGNGIDCTKCKRRFKNKTYDAYHIITFRSQYINTRLHRYKYKDCIRIHKIEIIISFVLILFLALAILISIMR